MNEIQLFNYEGRQVRTVNIDGSSWFIVSDLASILGYDSTSRAVRILADDEKGVHIVATLGGPQNMACCTEDGVYRLIFSSRQERAEAFRKWVYKEVLPSIRKTGSYSLPQTDEMVLASAVLLANRMIEAQKADIARMQPKEIVYDRCMSSDDALDMDAVGKMFGIGRNTLFARLRRLGVLRGNNIPYQEYAQYFKIVEKARMPDSNGVVKIDLSPKLKQTGLTWMARILGHGYQKQLPMGA